MTLKDDILHLRTLQAVDLQIVELDKEISESQKGLAKKGGEIAECKSRMEELTEKIDANEQKRRELEAELEDEWARIKDRQAKMMNVQADREYQSLLRETEAGKKANKQREEEIMKIMEEVESFKNKLEEETNLCKGLEEVLSDASKETENKVKKVETQRKKIEKAKSRRSRSYREKSKRRVMHANSYKELGMTMGEHGLEGFLFTAVTQSDHSTAIYLTLLFSFILFIVLVITARFVKLSEKLKLANQQLGLAVKETEEANLAKSRFLANMSHEIRTPLTTILGYADAVINQDINRESHFAVMKKVSASGNHLLGLINNILDFSKIESGELTIEKRDVNLADLIIETNQLALELVRGKPLLFQVIFTTSVPAQIIVDPIRLKQVLINLISNAVKFTPTGQIKLLISVKSENILFKVKDTGIGIAKKDLESLFDAFKQKDVSSTREYGGTGLGLSISQSIASHLDGSISVESIEGEGSSFTFSMKLSPVAGCEWITSLPGTRTDQMKASDHDTISGRVLLAEDNDENRQLIQIILQNLGLEVVTVINGQDAVEACLTENFQLILMDIQMPHLDGLGAIRLIKGAGVDVPILAVTANVALQDIELYKSSGFADCIAKPIERKKLIAAIKKFIMVEGNEDEKVIDEFSELKQQYRESFSEIISSLELSMANNDVTALGKVAHKIKGAAPTFGYQLIGEKAAELDAAVKEQLPTIDLLAGELLNLLKAAK